MPDFAAEIRRRLPELSIAPEREAEIVEELAQHLEDRERDLRAGGLSSADAFAAAIAELDGDDTLARGLATVERRVNQNPAVSGAAARGGWMSQLAYDVRFALRSLRKNPGFSATVACTLALGIGGTSAMFTLVDGILLRPLPYPHADRLVQVMQTYPEIGLDTWTLSQANVSEYRDRSLSFDGFAAYMRRGASLTGNDRPERLAGALVTGQFFRVLGVSAAHGRTIRPGDDIPGGSSVVVLSDGYWRQRFGGDTTLIGRSVQFDGVSAEVVGVMPPGFEYPAQAVQFWMPLGLDPSRFSPYSLRGVARLKPGVSPAAAQQETSAILWSAARANPRFVGGSGPLHEGMHLGTLVTPLKDAMTGRVARPLFVLQSAMLLILLIACANVATLLLGRATVRGREIVLRHTLGATPRRIVAQLLTESVVLSLAGAVAGMALAWAIVSAVTRLPLNIPRIEHVAIDGVTLGFTVSVSVMTGLLFGLVPAVQSRKLALSGVLADGSRGSAHASARRQHAALVIAQFALSLVLLIGSGLLIRSFHRMTAVDPGFRPAGVTAFTLPISPMKYDRARATLFHRAVLDSLRAIPGVTSAAVISNLPFNGSFNSDGYVVEGREQQGDGTADSQVNQEVVSPGYFATLGIPLVHGRDFDATDRAESMPVVIVDETLVRRFWPNGDALGKRIETTGDRVWLTIVGVVGGVHDQMLTDAPAPHMYTPEGQSGSAVMYAIARTSGDAGDLTRRLRQAVRALDPDLPVPDPRTMPEYLATTLDTRRLTNVFATAFAALAVLLACVGIYGVMALNVRRRTREFGIRLAIGAQPRQLVRSVLRQGLGLAGAGAAGGVIGALAMTHYLGSLLFEVSPTDPAVFVALSVGLVSIALVACALPAWRAGRSDPLVALRDE